MTPAARDAAAMTILDRWLNGQPLEAALTTWARGSRYAGSKDRAAIRDIVFDAVRRKRSTAALGGAETGRGLLIGLARARGIDLSLWDGAGYAPPPLDTQETQTFSAPMPDLAPGIAHDLPDWLFPHFKAALGEKSVPTLRIMQDRAPVFLRVNAQGFDLADRDGFRDHRAKIIEELADEGIDASAHPLAQTALLATGATRRIKLLDSYLQGRIELQDAASQAVAIDFCAALPKGTKVLDYCAGGGGKALAMSALGMSVTAHDIAPQRMHDLIPRAERAGARIEILKNRPTAVWPAILADAPCSGSGSWRRAPEAKWQFTPERLQELTDIQDDILSIAAGLIAPGGTLGYATCSILTEENEERVNSFLAGNSGWRLCSQRRFSPLDGGDGFFLAILQRAQI